MKLLSIEIPVYNEAQNIVDLIDRIERLSYDMEVIVIDDSSNDGTSFILEGMKKKYANLRVIQRPQKMGISSAVRDGLAVASGKYVVVMDADLQHPPEAIPSMIAQLERGMDIVIASRKVQGSHSSMGLWRRAISSTATFIAHLLLPATRRVRDPLSGFFAFRRKIVVPQMMRSNSYKVLLEILVRSRWKQIAEISYDFCNRKGGRSKLGIRELWRYLRLVLDLSQYRTLKFILVGIVGVIVNEGLLFLLAPHTPILIASGMAVEASIISNFSMNSVWTFRGRNGGGLLLSLAKYNLVTIFGALTNIGVLALLVAIHMKYLAANLLGIALGFAANYVMAEGVVWR